ncbi:MAG: tetratricopeptide repeat protein [Treponema sp.]|nr:tetratricopeptide repeat protein [Treponema sp.]
MFPIIIAVIVVMGFVLLLMAFMRRGKGSSGGSGKGGSPGKEKAKSQSQIIREANKRLAKNPHDPQGLSMLGGVYFSNSLWEKALPVYGELVRLAPAMPSVNAFEANQRHGICCINLDKLQEGVQTLTTAYKLNSRDFEVNYYLGLACFKSKQYDKAIPCFKKSLVANPEATGVYLMLGQSFYYGHHYHESLPYLKKALDEDPSNKEALYDMADAMTEEGRGEKAIKVFMHLRADPVYGAKSCLQAGIFHAKNNELDAAAQDFEIGLKHEEALPELRLEIQYRLAQVYFMQNQIGKGLSLLKAIRNVNMNYKDVNALISRYQELSQNSNLQIYLSAGNSDFVALCRKFIATKYKNGTVKILDINVGQMFTDILADISSSKWEDTELFRFFRTSGTTGELYVRDFHGHMQDIKADRGFCVTAGSFSDEGRKYIEGRPLDLIEKTELTKVLKQITI